MSNPASTAENPNNDFGAKSSPSPAQAANDLRTAAGEAAREIAATTSEKAAQLKERAIDTAQQFRDSATEKAAALRTAATDKATQFRDTAAEQWQESRVKAKEYQGTAEDYIRENPTQCVLAAVGAGFLLGLMVRR